MRHSTLRSASRAIYLLCVRRTVMFALVLTSFGNSVAITAIARQKSAEAPDTPRQQALLALEDIYTESKSYDDLGLRVRVKALLADVLWPVEPDRARDILTTAFDDATAYKQDLSKRRLLRSEIIRVAGRHDREMVKKLIARFDAEKEDESGQPPPRDSFDRSTERGGLLLDSAMTLLAADDQQGAVSLARRSLSEGRAGRFLFFLSQLMEKDQAAGEKLFLDALAVLRQGPSDPNDLLFYGMWMFYPNSMAVGTLGPRAPGSEIIPRASGVEVYSYGMDFSAAPPKYLSLLKPYLETSAYVLARFEATPGLPESVKAVELKRFALRQLLPLFEAHLPERAEAMRAELNALGVPPPWAVSPKETPGKNADPRFSDDLSTVDLITSVKKIPDELERDNIFFQQSLRAYNRGDFERASALASEITRSNSKESLMTVITYNRAQKEIEKGELDAAEKTATSQLDRVRRAEVYAQLYKAWAERGDMQRANELIAYAASEAAKVDPRSQRAQVYIYLASMVTARDATKAFEFLEGAVGDINAAEKFDPAGSVLLFEMQSPKGSKSMVGFSRSVSLLSVIPPLAKTDLTRAINTSRFLTVPESRALTVIAACRDVLASDKKKGEVKKAAPPATKTDKTEDAGKVKKKKQG
jgi:hypothetical protein